MIITMIIMIMKYILLSLAIGLNLIFIIISLITWL